MKIEVKLLLGSFLLVVLTAVITYLNYFTQQKNYKNLINRTMTNVVKKVNFDIDKTDQVVNTIFTYKSKLFENIHKTAINILKDNPNIPLTSLQQKLHKMIPTHEVKIHLYLINKDYIIYDTTFSPDKNLNMSKFAGGKENIDIAHQTSKIIISSPSIDILNKDYRIYSYGAVNKNTLLEIGFFDTSISKLKRQMYDFSFKNDLVKGVELFGDYQNYIVNLTKTEHIKYKTKAEFLDYLIKHKNVNENKIIDEISKTGKTVSLIEKRDNKIFKIFYTTIQNINISKSYYKNYIVKVTFDITQLERELDESKHLFYISLIILFLLFTTFLVYIQRTIFSPMDKKISQQYRELEELNAKLEMKVKSQVKEVKQSNQKFKTIFNTVKDGIAIIDLDSNFLLVNSAYEKITGLPKEELYKTSCASLSDSSDENEFTPIKDVLENGYYFGFEKECNIFGKKISVIMDFVKMENENNILVVTKDITKLKEKALQQKEQEKQLLEQSRLAQMGEMISMIAHQWRQPLGAISSAVVSIQNKLSLGKFDLSKSEDRDKFETFLLTKIKNIDEYIEFLSTTIDEFRNFYKKDKEKVESSTSEIVLKSLKIVKTSMNNKNIEIEYSLKDIAPIEVYKNELIQVILNILKNSEDNFLEKDIENKKVIINNYETDFSHTISIKDNGGGIDEDILPSIFEPYFSTKYKKNGTGLGLYMSKMIIEEHHNGELLVNNIENGVEFIINIPKEKSND